MMKKDVITSTLARRRMPAQVLWGDLGPLTLYTGTGLQWSRRTRGGLLGNALTEALSPEEWNE